MLRRTPINSFRRLLRCIVVVVSVTSTIFAQDAPVKFSRASAPTVTASASAELVRFTAPGNTTAMRVEVYSVAGERLFDSSEHAGNVLDWSLPDGQTDRLGDGSYLCVVTVKSLSGKVSQKLGALVVHERQLVVQPIGSAELSPEQSRALSQSLAGSEQAQSVGPFEEATALTVVSEGEPDAVTTVAHDGTKGEITRSRGALSFRVGDFFSGKDTEQMRLTEEGNLGLGTEKPKAKLDVAGTIRAREGFMFSDGSMLKVNEKGVLTRTSADGTAPSSVTSTLNRIARFTDNAGTVGDSVAIDTGTGLQLTAAPSLAVDTNLLYLNSTNGTTGVLAGSTPSYGAANGPFFAMRGNTYTTIAGQRGLFTIAAGNIASPAGDDGSVKFNTGNDLLRMVIRPSGNVGIGVSSPGSLLDVGGNINTGTQYNIGGSRVLSAAGVNNIFVGFAAGNANTTGQNNAFFGDSAGLSNSTGNFNSFFGDHAGASNTTGGSNSFFGRSSGLNNTTASNNSFFGHFSGLANTTGISNSFFGSSAGAANTIGSENSFFGQNAGAVNTTASNNSFFGKSAGANNLAGADNSFFGATAGQSNTTGSNNAFFGEEAGTANTTGNDNSFFGVIAGQSNTTGAGNSFFGRNTGARNTTGDNNSFFGIQAGEDTTTGSSNSFFGSFAGQFNTTGNNNSFFGLNAGHANTEGGTNSFFGKNAGQVNTEGASNTFLGYNSGQSNTTESSNTFIGANSNGAVAITNATAVGANATVTQSDSLVLGSDANVGVGASAPKEKLHVVGNIFVGGNPAMGAHGLILKSPNGATCAKLTIDNAGALVTTVIACP